MAEEEAESGGIKLIRKSVQKVTEVGKKGGRKKAQTKAKRGEIKATEDRDGTKAGKRKKRSGRKGE